MKKTLLPKLVAQKLEPPDLPMLQTSGSGWSLASSLMTQMTASVPVDDPEIWGIANNASPKSVRSTVGKQGQVIQGRRGSGSEHSQCTDAGAVNNKSTFAPPRLKPPPHPPLPYTKHRRGSHSDCHGGNAEIRVPGHCQSEAQEHGPPGNAAVPKREETER